MPKFDWLDQLAELPLDRTVKLVGFGLAHFASKNGQDVRPGLSRLMWVCGISDERTIAKAIKELRNTGLIGLYKAGGGRPAAGRPARADEYWLTTHDGVQGWKTSYEAWLKRRSA
jgi:hypothetical protein